MGAKSSKSMVFNHQPTVSIEFSPNFVQNFTEGDTSVLRPRSVEEQIEFRVQEALDKHDFERFVKEQSTVSVLEHELQETISNMKSYEKPLIDPEYLALESSVIECYRRNKQKVLDCYDEVENFKSAVQKAQREFVNSAAN